MEGLCPAIKGMRRDQGMLDLALATAGNTVDSGMRREDPTDLEKTDKKVHGALLQSKAPVGKNLDGSGKRSKKAGGRRTARGNCDPDTRVFRHRKPG